jgi:hypothetical protein
VGTLARNMSRNRSGEACSHGAQPWVITSRARPHVASVLQVARHVISSLPTSLHSSDTTSRLQRCLTSPQSLNPCPPLPRREFSLDLGKLRNPYAFCPTLVAVPSVPARAVQPRLPGASQPSLAQVARCGHIGSRVRGRPQRGVAPCLRCSRILQVVRTHPVRHAVRGVACYRRWPLRVVRGLALQRCDGRTHC